MAQDGLTRREYFSYIICIRSINRKRYNYIKEITIYKLDFKEIDVVVCGRTAVIKKIGCKEKGFIYFFCDIEKMVHLLYNKGQIYEKWVK